MADQATELIASLNQMASEEAGTHSSIRETLRASEKTIAMWKEHFALKLPFRGQTQPQIALMMFGLFELSLDWLIELMSSKRLGDWTLSSAHTIVGAWIDEALKRKNMKGISEQGAAELSSTQRDLSPAEATADLFRKLAALDDKQLAHWRAINTVLVEDEIEARLQQYLADEKAGRNQT